MKIYMDVNKLEVFISKERKLLVLCRRRFDRIVLVLALYALLSQ